MRYINSSSRSLGVAFGYVDKPAEFLFELIVGVLLLVGHLDEEVIVHAGGQIFEHFIAGAAQNVRLDERAEFVDVFVAENFV